MTLLHPPYTAWNLANVAIGAALAPHLYAGRLAAALVAFFLAVGICAHVLDELHGRPLGTHVSGRTLVVLAVVFAHRGRGDRDRGGRDDLAHADPVRARGRVHSARLQPRVVRWALSHYFLARGCPGVFPVLTAYWVNALELRPSALLAAGGCAMLLVAQRSLSTPVRELRRRTVLLTGEQRLSDGSTVPLDAARLAAPMERALQACAVAMVLLATGLVLARL